MKLNYSIKSNLNELQELTKTILDFCESYAYDAEFIGDIRLVFEEIIVNIIKHGYDDSPDGPINLAIEMESERWTMTVEDEGKPFNPQDFQPMNVEKPFDEKDIGGLGVHMIREMAEFIEYKRIYNKNRLKISLSNRAV